MLLLHAAGALDWVVVHVVVVCVFVQTSERIGCYRLFDGGRRSIVFNADGTFHWTVRGVRTVFPVEQVGVAVIGVCVAVEVVLLFVSGGKVLLGEVRVVVV